MARALGAIDVGSNAIRLTMVRVCPSGTLIDTQSHRYALRLGADVYSHGYVRESVAQTFYEVFRDIALRMRKFGVQERRAIATASLRDAKNREELTGRVYDEYGIHIDVVSGAEESELARTALIRALGFVDSDSLLLDLGGGSLELMGIDAGRGVSLPLGTVRLMEQHPALRGRCAVDEVTAARRAVLDVLSNDGLDVDAARCIGTGGNLAALARILAGPSQLWPAVDLTRLDRFIEELRQLEPSERVVAYGLRPDRADVLLPVAIVLSALRQRYGLDSVVVPGTGVREAILQALAAKPSSLDALEELLRRASVEAKPAHDRARLAAGLFQLLAPVHNLWPSAVHALELAAFGWELGQTINRDDPVRHGAYLIRHAEGLQADDDVRLVAAAAFRHSRGGRAHAATLNAEQRRATRVLGSVLEIASRAAPGAKPEDLRADLTGTDLWVAVGLNAQRRFTRLERALGRRLEIV